LRSFPSRENGPPVRAGISSFGLSGTNAHVILEEPPRVAEPPVVATMPPPPTLPLLFSGRTPAALSGQIHKAARYLAEHEPSSTLDLAHSLATTRTHFGSRMAILVDTAFSPGELVKLIEQSKTASEGMVAVTPPEHQLGKLAL